MSGSNPSPRLTPEGAATDAPARQTRRARPAETADPAFS